MSECDEILEELEVYLDGELPDPEARRVERHLSECGGCFQRQAFVQRLREILRRKCGHAELPPTVANRIRRALARTN